MTKIQIALLSAFLFAASGAAISAQADSPFPSDAEASYSLPAGETYADQRVRNADQRADVWGVGKRQVPTPHNPFPFGGGVVDD
jgi:hypothetical protein